MNEENILLPTQFGEEKEPDLTSLVHPHWDRNLNFSRKLPDGMWWLYHLGQEFKFSTRAREPGN